MNTADVSRVRRILVAIDRALSIFQQSKVKAAVGDIEAELKLRSLRGELESALATERSGSRSPLE
jgi:hypothetical protein